MPTHEEFARFMREYDSLSPERRALFLTVLVLFRADLRRGEFRPSLRVKRVVRHPGVWEMTWAPDGRATFSYGAEIISGQPHIIWRRIGTHDIFRQP